MRERVLNAFEQEVRRRGLTPVAVVDGDYEIRLADGISRKLALDNLVRTVEREGDLASVQAFVDAALSTEMQEALSPPYTDLRLALESRSIDLSFAACQPLSPQLSRVLVATPPDEAVIRYLSTETVEDVEGGSDAAMQYALNNMATLLSKTSVTHESAAGHPVAMFETHSPFKASLLCAPNLKETVERRLGWPVIAIAPARDFLMVFSAADMNSLAPRLGSVVVREYTRSPYPLTTEILRISDDGIAAVGAFDAGQK